MGKLRSFFCEIPTEDYNKLIRIIRSGKFATKVDFIRTKIREEKVERESKPLTLVSKVESD